MRWHSFSLVKAIRGELASDQARTSRPNLAFGAGLTPTMMQPCASAAKLRVAGPICTAARSPWGRAGHRYLGSSSTVRRVQQTGAGFAYLLIVPVTPLGAESHPAELHQS
jgi:hypothetical protein